MPIFTYAPSEVARRVLEGLGPAFLQAAGHELIPLLNGLVAHLDDLDQRIAATPGGWPAIFDLDQTPDPGWLGAAFGSPAPAGYDSEQARQYVRDRAYWRRGTPTAIKAAVADLLVGARRVDLYERDGSPWHLGIRVYPPDVPAGTDAAAILAAAASQKPIGITISVLVANGATYAHMQAEHGPTFADERADLPTFAAAIHHTPEEGTIP